MGARFGSFRARTMSERAQGGGAGGVASNHQDRREDRRGDAGLTFRAVGIPALAGALASAPRKPAPGRDHGRSASATAARQDVDTDDMVALRSRN